MEHAITWTSLLLGPLEHELAHYGVDPHAALDAMVVAAALLAFSFVAGRRFRRSDMVEPDGRVTLTFVAEHAIRMMVNFFEGIMSHGARPFFFLLGSFALFILGCNWIGLVPGFNPPTDQFNVTVTLALIVFVVTHVVGVRKHGAGYVKKFMGPLWWLAPLMLPIEIISHLVRPMSLSVRLFGNMTGEHQVGVVFFSLLAVGLPVPFMGLGVLIGFLQALVFVLLSAVYFEDALEAPH